MDFILAAIGVVVGSGFHRVSRREAGPVPVYLAWGVGLGFLLLSSVAPGLSPLWLRWAGDALVMAAMTRLGLGWATRRFVDPAWSRRSRAASAIPRLPAPPPRLAHGAAARAA